MAFAGREILGQARWTQGPVLMQALGMLAALDLRALGHNSARYIHVVTEALKLAFADRERYYGDRRRGVPIAELLVPGVRARARRAHPHGSRGGRGAGARRSAARAARAARAGARGRARGRGRRGRGADGTTHIAAIDRDGNMMCLTPSGGVFRKSAFAPELGCTLSTRSEMFVLEDGHPNGLTPGKRPRTTLVSYLICEDGVPTTTVGCPGGDDQAQADLQIVLNLLVFGMNPSRRSRPRASRPRPSSTRSIRASTGPASSTSSPASRRARAPSCATLGHAVSEIGACGIGAVVTRRDPETGVLSAGADPRRPTYALAW